MSTMTTTNSVTYTAAQFTAARSLARAYGHGWACSDLPAEHPIAGCSWTQALVHDLYTATCRRDEYEPWQYGIPDPGVTDYSGAVYHTTGTGRVSWRVAADGAVGIVISRPEPGRGDGRQGVVVLSARVRDGAIEEVRTPDTRDHRIPDVHTATWSPEDGPRAEARHGDALLEALCALVDCATARRALEDAGVPLTPHVDLEPADPLLQAALGGGAPGCAGDDPRAQLTCRVPLTDAARAVTITGDRGDVLDAIAQMHGLAGRDALDIRRDDDGGLIVVDARQAESYPAYLAEVVVHVTPGASGQCPACGIAGTPREEAAS